MLGLFGTLNMSARSMQVQQQGIEVAGHNMANVNNPAYARQRVAIETASSISNAMGTQGTGADSRQITQIRNVLLDNQIVTEESVNGSLNAQQQSLQYAQSGLGQSIDRGATGAEGAAAAGGTGRQHGIGDSLTELFNSFQRLSTQASSPTERGLVLKTASELTDTLNHTDQRIAALGTALNKQIETDVAQANVLLDDIARLNHEIGSAENFGAGAANDLRDTRQARLEELAKFIKFEAVKGDQSAVNISVGGVTLIDGSQVADHLETYDSGGGNLLIRTAATDTNLNVTGGSLHGAISTRDGAIQNLRDEMNSLAATLITEVNRLHTAGFGKNGTTGLNFFEGTDASNITVNRELIDDPDKIQASDTSGEVGNKGIILAMARLSTVPQGALRSQTFSQSYSTMVADLGQSLNSVNDQISDQTVVTNMLKAQRDSISAVSIDEEMTDLIKYQKAYQASAQLVNTVNEMLETIINMMR